MFKGHLTWDPSISGSQGVRLPGKGDLRGLGLGLRNVEELTKRRGERQEESLMKQQMHELNRSFLQA